MRVLVVTSRVPFVHGAAEELCDALVDNLRLYGADAEALQIPFTCEPAERLIEEMLIPRSLHLANIDRVIGLRFPAYVVPHHNKVLWLHDGSGPASEASLEARIRRAVWHAQDIAFSEARQIYTATPAVAHAARRSHRFESTLMPAPRDEDGWKSAIQQLLS